MTRILTVVTSCDQYQKVGYRTGLWLGELTHFFDVADEAGCEIDVASPAGGLVPIDPESLLLSEVGEAVGVRGRVFKRYQDKLFMDRLVSSLALSQLVHDSYDAIYLTGGHGVMFDFRCDQLARLITSFYEAGKIVSAVCHGPCGLLDAKLTDGSYLIEDKKVTGFSWQEEILAKRDFAVPFSLEEQLQSRGAVYSKTAIPFGVHTVEDGLLVTGQNPSSAEAVAQIVIGRLQKSTADS